MVGFNERITENIVRKKFEPSLKDGFIIEEQQSKNPRIRKLLQSASKKGNGKGFPEFIISHKEDCDFLVIVECKADKRYHQSKTSDRYKEYAVDGVMLYSSHLSKDFNVISLAVSGQSEDELVVSGFLQLKKSEDSKLFVRELINLPDLRKKYIYDESTKHQKYEELLDYNRSLNQTLHNYKIREADRSLLLSGILIALEHDVFQNGYTGYRTSAQLADGLVSSVIQQLQNSNIPDTKIKTLEHAYSFIKTNATLSKNKDIFIDLINEVDAKINTFAKTYKFHDIFGELYIEFLRYANSDKGLGIVLTPKHITELFCELVGVTKDSIVFDNCCGTGGFLITAMRKMMGAAGSNSEKEHNIKEKQIIGIEFQDSIFPLACSNMIIHGDGKTNLFNDNCFDLNKKIREIFRPTIGLLNPPFKTDKKDIEELEFVLNNLQGLQENALCAALLPMQCVLAQKGERLALKRRIMRDHTLEAVMSLPDEIFYNSKVSVVTCVIIVRAHKPHPADFETYFGYWKQDGFVKRKNKGRIDANQKWEKIQKEWLKSFRNRKSIPGLSVMKVVKPEDEWCAEAYMETDYKTLTDEDFTKTIKNFVAFQFLYGKN